MRLTVDRLCSKLNIPLEDFTNITIIDLPNAQISDIISLVKCNKLEVANLNGNMFQISSQLDGLLAAPNLKKLNLMGSPVTKITNYRAYAIAKASKLEILDNKQILDTERILAYRLYPQFKPDNWVESSVSANVQTVTQTLSPSKEIDPNDEYLKSLSVPKPKPKVKESTAPKISTEDIFTSPVKKELKKEEEYTYADSLTSPTKHTFDPFSKTIETKQKVEPSIFPTSKEVVTKQTPTKESNVFDPFASTPKKPVAKEKQPIFNPFEIPSKEIKSNKDDKKKGDIFDEIIIDIPEKKS